MIPPDPPPVRMIYAPPPLFGLASLKFDPVEVEVLENPAIVHGVARPGMARIRIVVPKDALINILAKIPPERREDRLVERIVIAEDLKPLEPT